jgi:hypothetical protein
MHTSRSFTVSNEPSRRRDGRAMALFGLIAGVVLGGVAVAAALSGDNAETLPAPPPSDARHTSVDPPDPVATTTQAATTSAADPTSSAPPPERSTKATPIAPKPKIRQVRPKPSASPARVAPTTSAPPPPVDRGF